MTTMMMRIYLLAIDTVAQGCHLWLFCRLHQSTRSPVGSFKVPDSPLLSYFTALHMQLPLRTIFLFLFLLAKCVPSVHSSSVSNIK